MPKNSPAFRRKSSKKILMFMQLAAITLLIVVTFVGVLNIQVVREFFSRATGEPANLIVDVQSDLGPMPRPWRNLAQGGEAFDWDMGPIAPKVRALNPEYIRIDHIYDFYDIVQRNGDQLTFDFTKLDAILDDIEETGATPFIALSYMPTALATSDIVSEPHSWSEWQLTVQKTIEHVSGTRGFNNVYYEVWNEPDLFGKWSRSGNRNYLTMYTYSARGAAAAQGVQPFKLGGPAITALYRNWFYDLLRHTSNNNLRLDFFSWHRYNLDVDQYRKDIDEAHTWLADFPQYQNLELVISEWGHDSDVHPGYDGSFGAVHTAAVSIEMVGVIEKGFVFEIEDGKDPQGREYWGRWGLMTNQDFGAKLKPRYRALQMIDQLGVTRLNLIGKGSWVKAVASRDLDDTVKVLVANYDPAGQNSEMVPLTFVNIFPGEYQIKRTFLGGQSSQEVIATDSAVLATTVNMSPNTVAMIEMRQIIEATPSLPTSTTSATPTQSATGSAIPTPTSSIFNPTPPVSTDSGTGFGRLIEQSGN